MKSLLIGAALVAALAGCASAPYNDAPPHGANSVYDDPTYPGSGVHIGIGAGSWGGRGGGGVGIGLGF
jgi:opacity protein-like surface antigen